MGGGGGRPGFKELFISPNPDNTSSFVSLTNCNFLFTCEKLLCVLRVGRTPAVLT